ncbi:TOBE domain-containing protein [Noviherbaspirillum denitrificans]|uniref:Molybdenum-dependent transcriptional regulator n=1 Tax=Noviherbaspirillum denitrificans TaxID=1968433 RepID=A0A254T9Z2_9BURK|nr:TOBE domain-containing protein [Noviherbaspirillum denitrificans]OWW19466.1 molybdenum-dependent transcriptional regulator [Noviherbaspirillum denitrificans]
MPPPNKMHIDGRLWIAKEESNLAGHGRVDLLQRIAETGSISQAAKSIGMSYKAAWDAVDAMNNLAGEPLVQRSTGGKGGGGTRLTARGERLVAAFRLIEEEHRRFLQALGENIDDFSDTYQLIRRLNMKTSARNQFYGKVADIRSGAVNDEVIVELQGGDRIVAVITQESTRHLGLRAGSDVVALIKAPWVMVAEASGNLRLSAQNRLAGTVVKLQRGAVNAEVVIQLAGGTTVCAIISNDSATELDLAEGKPAAAIFNASHVILGVPAY